MPDEKDLKFDSLLIANVILLIWLSRQLSSLSHCSSCMLWVDLTEYVLLTFSHIWFERVRDILLLSLMYYIRIIQPVLTDIRANLSEQTPKVYLEE